MLLYIIDVFILKKKDIISPIRLDYGNRHTGGNGILFLNVFLGISLCTFYLVSPLLLLCFSLYKALVFLLIVRMASILATEPPRLVFSGATPLGPNPSCCVPDSVPLSFTGDKYPLHLRNANYRNKIGTIDLPHLF